MIHNCAKCNFRTVQYGVFLRHLGFDDSKTYYRCDHCDKNMPILVDEHSVHSWTMSVKHIQETTHIDNIKEFHNRIMNLPDSIQRSVYQYVDWV